MQCVGTNAGVPADVQPCGRTPVASPFVEEAQPPSAEGCVGSRHRTGEEGREQARGGPQGHRSCRPEGRRAIAFLGLPLGLGRQPQQSWWLGWVGTWAPGLLFVAGPSSCICCLVLFVAPTSAISDVRGPSGGKGEGREGSCLIPSGLDVGVMVPLVFSSRWPELHVLLCQSLGSVFSWVTVPSSVFH